MPDTTDSHEPAQRSPSAIGEVIEGIEPMGDLSRFAIEDLTQGEEDEFFKILDDA